MKINLLFFGKLAEIVHNQKEFKLDSGGTIDDLKKELLGKFPELAEFTYRIAVNEEMIKGNHKLIENDVVAFMPPFAGG